jgi:hypothetical protein
VPYCCVLTKLCTAPSKVVGARLKSPNNRIQIKKPPN